MPRDLIYFADSKSVAMLEAVFVLPCSSEASLQTPHNVLGLRKGSEKESIDNTSLFQSRRFQSMVVLQSQKTSRHSEI